MKFIDSVWNLLKKAFQYHLIKGAAVLKLVQAVLILTGRQPWTAEQNMAVETLIDFTVGIIVLVGVGHAHDNQTK